jgi:hypothetical protein
MNDGAIAKSDLLRMVGLMSVGIGLAWAYQILALAGDASGFDRMMWVLAAATIAGAGVGTLYTSSALRDQDGARA